MDTSGLVFHSSIRPEDSIRFAVVAGRIDISYSGLAEMIGFKPITAIYEIKDNICTTTLWEVEMVHISQLAADALAKNFDIPLARTGTFTIKQLHFMGFCLEVVATELEIVPYTGDDADSLLNTWSHYTVKQREKALADFQFWISNGISYKVNV